VRRGLIPVILTLLLVCGGLALLCYDLGQRQPYDLGATVPQKAFGVAVLALAAVWALLVLLGDRSDVRALAEQVRQRGTRTGLPPLDVPRQAAAELAGAVNDLIAEAEQTVTGAAVAVKELEIQLKVAHAERQHAEAIINSISDAVVVTDPFDDLVLANESAARAFNFELTASGRRPVDRVLSDEKIVGLIREMRQSKGQGGRRVVEHVVRTPSGERSYKITLSCVSGQKDAGGGGVVAVLHDMTREKEVARMKNDFVSSVSHELRTPLASIKAYVEMLIDGEAQDEKTRSDFYEVIQNESNRLSRLIDNILNISRIESGLVKVNKQPLSLTVVMKEAMEVIAPQARGKQITLVDQLTPVFYQVMADRDMIYQALLNLMSNAVKYTPEGGQITIQTSLDEPGKKVIARIVDTGVGIPPKDLPFVFDKFFRSDANSRMAKGTGLGLSLVKHIVETVHRGRVLVGSEPGKGSTFGFELDLSE
jgi:two-component system phosphate regulon sensor histidine kinase PhoR